MHGFGQALFCNYILITHGLARNILLYNSIGLTPETTDLVFCVQCKGSPLKLRRSYSTQNRLKAAH